MPHLLPSGVKHTASLWEETYYNPARVFAYPYAYTQNALLSARTHASIDERVDARTAVSKSCARKHITLPYLRNVINVNTFRRER